MIPYSRTGKVKVPRKFNRFQDDEQIDRRDLLKDEGDTMVIFEAKKISRPEICEVEEESDINL